MRENEDVGNVGREAGECFGCLDVGKLDLKGRRSVDVFGSDCGVVLREGKMCLMRVNVVCGCEKTVGCCWSRAAVSEKLGC